MKSEIKSSEGLAREIEVEVPVETVDAAFAEAYHKFGKDAKIKGFRPGKVPMHVIKSKYGEAIKEEILQDILEKTYPEIVKEHQLKVASPPNITDFEINEGAPLKYTAKIEVMPEIEKVNMDELILPEQEFEVRDTEVDAVLDYLKKKVAEVKPVEREAKATDVLVMDLEKTDDPNDTLPEGDYSGTEIDLDNESTMPEFKEKLVGMKIGEEREVPIEYPDNFANKVLAGNKITYKCKLTEVKERVMPAETDDFAKAQSDGACATMLELRLKIREDLKKQKGNDHRQWQKRELMQQIIEKNKFDIPEAMVEKYLDSAIEDMKKENPDIERAAVEEQYRPVAVEAIRWNFLADHITEAENIEVLPSDTENWIKSFAEGYKIEPEKAMEILSQTGRINEVRNSILEDKIFNFLLTKVKFVPAQPETTISGEPEKAEPDDKDETEENTTTEEK